jgi:hypothetical protein
MKNKGIYVIWPESHRAAFNTNQQLFVSEAFEMKKGIYGFGQKVTGLLLTPINNFLCPRHSNEKRNLCHNGRKSHRCFKHVLTTLCI